MPETCQPKDLVVESECFTCLSELEQLAVQTYLLNLIQGGNGTPKSLKAAATCFECLSVKDLLAIQVYLMCQIVNA